MPHTTHNPDGLHNPTPFGYSHTASVPASASLVFVSGQYGSDRDGAVVPGGFAEQVARAFSNLETALAGHGLGPDDVVQLRTYVVNHDFDKLGVITRTVQEKWGDTPPTQTLIGAASLAIPDVLFEVDAIAAVP